MRLLMLGFLVFGGLLACGGDDGATDASADSARPDTGTPDTGADADAGDAGPDADAGCEVIAWSTTEVFRVSGTCGPGVDEGTNLCLEITVSATGEITEAVAGPSSDQSLDATQAACIRAELVGRCDPSLAGQPPNEQCAIGI